MKTTTADRRALSSALAALDFCRTERGGRVLFTGELGAVDVDTTSGAVEISVYEGHKRSAVWYSSVTEATEWFKAMAA